VGVEFGGGKMWWGKGFVRVAFGGGRVWWR